MDKYSDTIDSREVIERIEELQAAWDEAAGDDHTDYVLSEDDWAVHLGADDAAELVALLDFAKDGETNCAGWVHGETLINADYFTEYAKELAADLGAIMMSELAATRANRDFAWPLTHIDWDAAAAALKSDYNELTFDGVTFYAH